MRLRNFFNSKSIYFFAIYNIAVHPPMLTYSSLVAYNLSVLYSTPPLEERYMKFVRVYGTPKRTWDTSSFCYSNLFKITCWIGLSVRFFVFNLRGAVFRIFWWNLVHWRICAPKKNVNENDLDQSNLSTTSFVLKSVYVSITALSQKM